MSVCYPLLPVPLASSAIPFKVVVTPGATLSPDQVVYGSPTQRSAIDPDTRAADSQARPNPRGSTISCSYGQ